MYRVLTVNNDIDLVKLLWDIFPDSLESEIEELLGRGWVKVGDVRWTPSVGQDLG